MSHSDTLDEVDHKIVKHLIENPSVTDDALAIELNLSRRTINRRRNSESIRKLLSESLQVNIDEIRRLTKKALSRIESELDNPNPNIKLFAANSIVKLSSSIISTDIKNTKIEDKETVLRAVWGRTKEL